MKSFLRFLSRLWKKDLERRQDRILDRLCKTPLRQSEDVERNQSLLLVELAATLERHQAHLCHQAKLAAEILRLEEEIKQMELRRLRLLANI